MIVIIIIVIFCPNIIAFCSIKLDFFLEAIRNSASKSLRSIEISLYPVFNEWMKCCQKRKIINEWFILLRDIILLRKSQLVTSYSLKLDVNRCFWNPVWSKCKHVYKPVGSFINNRVCQYVNTTDLIVIEHYIAI